MRREMIIKDLKGLNFYMALEDLKNWVEEDYEGFELEGMVEGNNKVLINFGEDGLDFTFGRDKQEIANKDNPDFVEEYNSYPVEVLDSYLEYYQEALRG